MSKSSLTLPVSSSAPGALLGWGRATGARVVAVLVGFALAFAVADRVVAWGLERLLLKSQFRYSVMYRGGLEAEVVILGNSRGVNGFYAPDLARALGRRVLNLSFNGLSAEMGEVLLLDYLERNPAPRRLWLEVTNLHNGGLNGNVLQLYGGMSPRLAEAWRAEQPTTAWMQRWVSQAYRFSGEFYLRALYYLRRSDQDWINRYRIDEAFAARFVPTEAMQAGWAAPAPERLAALRRTIEIAEAAGIEVSLVVTPYLPNYIKGIEAYPVWRSEVERVLGRPILDLSHALEKAAHFADPLHMNLEGFRVLLPELLGELGARD